MRPPIIYLVDERSGEAIRQATPVEIANAQRSRDGDVVYQGRYQLERASLGRLETDEHDNLCAVVLTKEEIDALIP